MGVPRQGADTEVEHRRVGKLYHLNDRECACRDFFSHQDHLNSCQFSPKEQDLQNHIEAQSF